MNANVKTKGKSERKRSYYICECGKKLRVSTAYQTERYGLLEYMRCSTCKEQMVAQNGKFLGIAARS